MNYLKFNFLTESTSLPTTLTALASDVGDPIQTHYQNLTRLREKFFAERGTLKGFGFVAGNVGRRWFDTYYFNRISRELRDLVRYAPQQTRELQDFLQHIPSSFDQIVDLPEILVTIGVRLKHEQLIHNARAWIRARQTFSKNKPSDNDTRPTRDYDAPSADSIATKRNQMSQADQVVADILAGLPRNQVWEIKAAIEKKPNKLQALQWELQKRGLTFSQ